MLYEVDVARIERQLSYLETCVSVIERVRLQQAGRVERFAVERALHVAVECVIEVGSVLIDGFMMREPGGYLDIIAILEDEKVIPVAIAVPIKAQVRLRERLVRAYDRVTKEELAPWVEGVNVYRTFIQHVRRYLQRELGA
jgi:uncharacterized protein YutE (UPF0331/DUF86 family)